MVRCLVCERMIDTDYNVEDVAKWEPEIICIDCLEDDQEKLTDV